MATATKKNGSTVTHVCCSRCRLRFTPEASAYIAACPQCGERPQEFTGQNALGFRLVGPEDLPIELPQAVAVAVPSSEFRGHPGETPQ